MRIFSCLACISLFLLVLSSYSAKPEGAIFFEDFSEGLENWVQSSSKESNGRFVVKGKEKGEGIVSDVGLVVPEAYRTYSICKPLDEEFDNTEKDLVIQYEVKLQEEISCSGFYLKLVADSEDLDLTMFDRNTQYSIMFGGDICGATDKVHFIYKHKHPITGEITEHQMFGNPWPIKDELTHLYTLLVHPNNTFRMYIDMEEVHNGSLLEDFNPKVNPNKMIPDPSDIKPIDWVNEEVIYDPEDIKPEDWVDEAEIVDVDDLKPEGWVDEDYFIPDPDEEQPEEWDTELDGEWEPPLIHNPKCEMAVGCGEWTKRMIPNPDFKGVWEPKWIPNPEFKGKWKQKVMPNPDYFEDLEPYKFLKIAAVGVDIWTTNKLIYFDNILMTYDLKTAFKYANETFNQTRILEHKYHERSMINSMPSAFQVIFREIVRYLTDLFEGREQIPIAIVVTAALAPFSIFISMLFVFRKYLKALLFMDEDEEEVVQEDVGDDGSASTSSNEEDDHESSDDEVKLKQRKPKETVKGKENVKKRSRRNIREA